LPPLGPEDGSLSDLAMVERECVVVEEGARSQSDWCACTSKSGLLTPSAAGRRAGGVRLTRGMLCPTVYVVRCVRMARALISICRRSDSIRNRFANFAL